MRFSFVLFSFLSLSLLAEDGLKVMTYNVWYGFNRKKSIPQAKEWLKGQDIDALALQELKGISQNQLTELAAEWGHPHAVLLKRKTSFPQGFTSKTPIEQFAPVKPEGKGYRETLHCKTRGIHFLVVHLNPQNYLKRQVEASAVAAKVQSLIAAGEKVIVLGDFNAHSQADRQSLKQQLYLLDKWWLKEKDKKGYKQFDAKGEVDFSVMRTFFDSGLKDISPLNKSTFPTRILAPNDDDEIYASKQQRIDFILISSSLKSATAAISYPQQSVLHEISDHFPVLLKL